MVLWFLHFQNSKTANFHYFFFRKEFLLLLFSFLFPLFCFFKGLGNMFSMALICGASSRYPYKVRDHINSPRSKKNTREAEFQAFHHFFFGGRGKVTGKLYIDLKHRIWRIQICQKEEKKISNIIWLSWCRTTYGYCLCSEREKGNNLKSLLPVFLTFCKFWQFFSFHYSPLLLYNIFLFTTYQKFNSPHKPCTMIITNTTIIIIITIKFIN